MNRRESQGRPKSLNELDRETLSLFSGALEALYGRVVDMTPEERDVLKDAALRTSETNCGWMIYEAADVALEYLRMSEPKAATG